MSETLPTTGLTPLLTDPLELRAACRGVKSVITGDVNSLNDDRVLPVITYEDRNFNIVNIVNIVPNIGVIFLPNRVYEQISQTLIGC